MSNFAADANPLEQPEALARHIEKALATEPPQGWDQDLSYRVIQQIFRPTVIGAEKIPDRPSIFIGNHSLFALDGFILGPVMQNEYGRFLRAMGDKFLFTNDAVGDRILRMGGVMGHPEVCDALMENGHDILVFPGGAHEAVKPSSALYELQWRERYGFVKLAARHGYTIVPFGMVGPDEFYGHLIEGQDLPDSPLGHLLKRMGLLTDDTRRDMLPPIPLGLLGSLLPKPQACYLGFGEAIDLAGHKGKRITKKTLQTVRGQVAGQIEEQLSELLLLRARERGQEGLLRRLLTF